MKCPFCNQEIEDNSKFCTYCGGKIEKTTSKTASSNETDTVTDNHKMDQNHSVAQNGGITFRHYGSKEQPDSASTNTQNTPPFTGVPPYAGPTNNDSPNGNNIPTYGNNTGSNIPPYGNGAAYNTDSKTFSDYLSKVKTIKILSIVGIVLSIYLVGTVLGVIALIMASQLPDANTMQIPPQRVAEYEKSIKDIKFSRTLNIITFVFSFLSFIS